ncbi:hypothetical protein FRB94_000419 [Tulasnella sp. JGI-2019a]|nr:hypothetical protein FRB94_000419 [Tulasnella sp. JGI-2019a]
MIAPNISTRQLRDTRVNGLPRLTLSSSDSHFIMISKQVASGRFGDTYQGVHVPTQLKLAMRCSRTLAERATQAQRFEGELKIRSSSNHVNVMPFYGVVWIFSTAYLVTPWVEHGDPSRFISAHLEYLAQPPNIQQSLSDQTRAAFSAFDEIATSRVHGIASGLAYLHASGVIHGDIKAANILLTDALTPLLGGFTFAKSEEIDNTFSGLKVIGSARWKSPELIDNEQSQTIKTDIYALGMTIVEVLTGQEPFPRLRVRCKVYKTVSEGHRPPFEPLSRNGKDVTPLWELAACCWGAEPECRPTAAEIV